MYDQAFIPAMLKIKDCLPNHRVIQQCAAMHTPRHVSANQKWAGIHPDVSASAAGISASPRHKPVASGHRAIGGSVTHQTKQPSRLKQPLFSPFEVCPHYRCRLCALTGQEVSFTPQSPIATQIKPNNSIANTGLIAAIKKLCSITIEL